MEGSATVESIISQLSPTEKDQLLIQLLLDKTHQPINEIKPVDLPLEMCQHIIGHLDTEALYKFRAICPAWKEIIDQRLSNPLDFPFFNLLAMYWNGNDNDGSKSGFSIHLVKSYLNNNWGIIRGNIWPKKSWDESVKLGFEKKPWEYYQICNSHYQQLLDFKWDEKHHKIMQTILLNPTQPIYPSVNVGKFILLAGGTEYCFFSPSGKFSYQEMFTSCIAANDGGFIFKIGKFRNGILVLEKLSPLEWCDSKIIKPGMVDKAEMVAKVKENYL